MSNGNGKTKKTSLTNLAPSISQLKGKFQPPANDVKLKEKKSPEEFRAQFLAEYHPKYGGKSWMAGPGWGWL